MPIDPETSGLDLRCLPLSGEARELLVRYADSVERSQSYGGDMSHLTGTASKSAEQAARIAGVLTLWRDLDAPQVEAADMVKRLSPINSTSTQGARKVDNQPNNPKQPERLAKAPRCLALTRMGTECQSPAVKGKARCRMHGGKGSGAPRGNRNAWRHGARSVDAQLLREVIRLIGSQNEA